MMDPIKGREPGARDGREPDPDGGERPGAEDGVRPDAEDGRSRIEGRSRIGGRGAIEKDGPDLKAPDGARCSAHPDRPARRICPRCGSYACAPCWHEEISLCDACLRRDPEQANRRPPPFEDARLPGLVRVASTMRAAFRPWHSALSFTTARVEMAVRFAILTALPSSALAGIIPHTRTMLFSPGLGLDLVGRLGSTELTVDVLRAMLVQLLFDGTTLAALLLPFATLTRSYARAGGPGPALCTVLYRAWLLPGASLVSYLAFWVLPDAALGTATMLILSTLALVLMVYAMWGTARRVSGIGPGMSLVVMGVSWAVAIVVSMLTGPVLAEAFGLPDPGAFGMEGQGV